MFKLPARQSAVVTVVARMQIRTSFLELSIGS